MLLDAGADVNLAALESGVTPLAAAVIEGAAACVRQLLAKGADPELTDAELYREFVIYGVLACPATLNNHDVDALFKTVAQDSLVIPIFRDFMLNIHVEVLLAPEAG